ncbi:MULTISPECIES: c-type cytochrome [unclassified Modicisalibacter]|uniref:c-type cytochrome n=1 Tax=unclassified Modicisalibacter TaxID=2679913 RepID=UPI001CCA040F|nr:MULTISPECIES: c-type cytochrome [unclassified Modicisalibacter]MBZ9558866.1 cytochrome c4 [Modicisalibacter sp. R2A 31.J]MBZ9575242.1 cytochrome c4 [Modicisalibacter sp. MOD 31.J]
MKRILMGLAAALVTVLGGAGGAWAQTPIATPGSAEAGRDKAQICSACHGAEGVSQVPAFPNLAGQQASYLAKQLADIRDGRRSVPQMAGVVAGLDDRDIADLAAYYASLPSHLGQADPALAERGRRLYKGGDPEAGLPACAACHTPTGQGLGAAGFPALSGQHPPYTRATLEAFASGTRDNDPNAIMRDIAARLSDAQIEALADYLSGLH